MSATIQDIKKGLCLFHRALRSKLYKRPSLWVGVGVCLLFSCSSINCPVDNTVYTIYEICTREGDADTLNASLSVRTVRMDRDTLVYNQGKDLTKLTLPISYQCPEDTLMFRLAINDSTTVTDTVWVNKEDQPHFESVDCGAIFFHELRGVRSTHHAIDTIIIVNPHVNYDHEHAHFQISFK